MSTDLTLGQQQLRSMVADQLRAAISEGRLLPGEWLRQERLARELGVSHMPVPEALKQLAAEGLIEYLPYRGMRVVEFSPDDIEDVYATRAALESRAAAAAARHITPEQVSELRALAAEMAETLGPDDLDRHRSANRRFHELICRASGRAYLTRTLQQMWQWFPTMFLGTFPTTAHTPVTDNDTTLDEHEAIIRALADHDADLACRLVQAHVAGAGHNLASLLRGAEKEAT